jgi:hypothetical protein
LSSSIIYQFPSIDGNKFKCYEFLEIEEAIFRNNSISKYEIPQYIQDIPEGFSIFCTLWEASKVKQYVQLTKEEQDRLGVGENEENNKDNDNVMKEPIPKTNFCHLCRRNFDDYLIHIETITHKNNISKNQIMINTVKNSFKRINQFWSNNKKNNLNNEFNQKSENKLYLKNYSSFSSAVSTFKCDESIIKDINSFLLDQEASDIEKNNNKENQCENKFQKKSKRYRHTKNKSHFITPMKNEKFLENKFSSHLSSSQSSFNLFINKKRKGNNLSDSGKINSSIEEEKTEKNKDYFTVLDANNSKQLINGGVTVFFE